MAKKSSASSRHAGLTSMTSEDIKNREWTEAERKSVKHHAAKQAGRDDSDINFDDIPQLTAKQLAQMVRLRDLRPKVPVSVRLDPNVLEWLKSKGEGHLTRINDILKIVMEAERRLAQQ
ncbi:MAG: BrnA antitoxin family protein [Acidobacteria bacterium]|nr:BrnA antitoxin family protein [Acidobacteriota bacterium]